VPLPINPNLLVQPLLPQPQLIDVAHPLAASSQPRRELPSTKTEPLPNGSPANPSILPTANEGLTVIDLTQPSVGAPAPEVQDQARTKRRQLTRDQRLQVKTLRDINWTYEQIAKHFGFSMRAVQYACTNPLDLKKKRGRASKISEEDVRRAMRFMDGDGRQIPWRRICEVLDISAGEEALRHALRKKGYRRREPRGGTWKRKMGIPLEKDKKNVSGSTAATSEPTNDEHGSAVVGDVEDDSTPVSDIGEEEGDTD